MQYFSPITPANILFVDETFWLGANLQNWANPKERCGSLLGFIF
jgi:hypothetical protein